MCLFSKIGREVFYFATFYICAVRDNIRRGVSVCYETLNKHSNFVCIYRKISYLKFNSKGFQTGGIDKTDQNVYRI